MSSDRSVDRFRVGFCVSGHGQLFRAAVVNRARLRIDAALAVLDTTSDSDLVGFCDQREIPHLLLDRREPKQNLADQVSRRCIDAELALLCLTFDRIVQPELVRACAGRIINVHPALLPSFKGLNALERAVDVNVKFAGATIHEVVDEVDSGPIIAQCVVGLHPGDDSASLGGRLFNQLRLMYLQVILWYRDDRIQKDDAGRLWVRDGVYGQFPISPAVEEAFPE